MTNPHDGPRWTQFEQDLRDELERAIADAVEVSGVCATLLAEQVVEALAKRYPGTEIYVPSTYNLRSRKSQAEIWATFSGDNQHEIARKYGVTLRWVRKVIARARERDIAQRQLGLPSFDR